MQFFRLSEDGHHQVNLAQAARVSVAPRVNAIGAVEGYLVEAHITEGTHARSVVLKSFTIEQDSDEGRRKCAQRAMDYLAGIPLSVQLEGVAELWNALGPVVKKILPDLDIPKFPDVAPRRSRQKRKAAASA